MKNIIILGAFINNKGAQSMIFTVVNEIRKEFPNSNISVLVNHSVSEHVANEYSFNFITSDVKNKLKLAGGVFSPLSFLAGGKGDKESTRKLESLVSTADLFIDISGFALSSKFSKNNTINYLSQIALAKKYNKPIVLFPQSFGPFNYGKIEKPLLMLLIRKYLKYPTKIYAREKEGYEYLKSLGIKDAEITLDTVFQKNDDYNLDHIFKNRPIIRELSVGEGAVAVIPNIKTINKDNKDSLYQFYNTVINELIALNKKVYLIRHSTEDLVFIQNIYQSFEKNNSVHLIEEEYNSIELHSILSKFDYVVASRYHSIVHAYKAGTPALVLGWAVKYKELLQNFEQVNYQFDVGNMDIEEFITRLKAMNENYMQERNVILNKLDNIKEDSIFKIINNILK